jgi:hypothetical protein
VFWLTRSDNAVSYEAAMAQLLSLDAAAAPLVSRYPAFPESVNYGWRWYRAEDNLLKSPLVGRITLPRDGALEQVYFIPGADEMFWTAAMIKAQDWYDFALAFGEVKGPFTLDETMPRVGSMKCARYRALAIFADSPAVQTNYAVPVLCGLSLDQMLAIEAAAPKYPRLLLGGASAGAGRGGRRVTRLPGERIVRPQLALTAAHP